MPIRRFPLLALCLLSILAMSEARAQSSYARAGWFADLSTNGHNVSGRVTILDADTFRVSNFNYDGGGLSVFFYLGLDETRDSFIAGIPANDASLLGTPRTNATLTYNLPNGATFDGYNAIAVWCVPARANFGSGTFVSPVPAPEPGAISLLAVSGLLLLRRRRRSGAAA